jgi:hypothetical protein
MADKVKTVRLRDVVSGAVVETSEENAERLNGFESIESKSTAKRSPKKSE